MKVADKMQRASRKVTSCSWSERTTLKLTSLIAGYRAVVFIHVALRSLLNEPCLGRCRQHSW